MELAEHKRVLTLSTRPPGKLHGTTVSYRAISLRVNQPQFTRMAAKLLRSQLQQDAGMTVDITKWNQNSSVASWAIRSWLATDTLQIMVLDRNKMLS